MDENTENTESVEETVRDDAKAMADPAPQQRGVFLEIGAGDEIVFHPINMEPLAISAVVLMAANLVKKSLDI